MEYYIYTLTDPISLEVRYIGKTKNMKDRLQRHMLPSNLKALWQPKIRWLKYLKNNNLHPIMELLDIGDENTIDDLEIYWISQFKTWDIRLTNVAKGGANPNPKGEKLRKEHVESLIKNYHKRTPVDSSSYDSIRKSVVQYTLDNVFIKEFVSVNDAMKQTGLHHISDCCNNKRHYVGEYYFRYKDNYFPYVEKVNHWIGKEHTEQSKLKIKMNHPLRKVICQYIIRTGENVGEYLSSYDAEKQTGLCRSHIIRCCKNIKSYDTVGGYYFRFKDNYFPFDKKNHFI